MEHFAAMGKEESGQRFPEDIQKFYHQLSFSISTIGVKDDQNLISLK